MLGVASPRPGNRSRFILKRESTRDRNWVKPLKDLKAAGKPHILQALVENVSQTSGFVGYLEVSLHSGSRWSDPQGSSLSACRAKIRPPGQVKFGGSHCCLATSQTKNRKVFEIKKPATGSPSETYWMSRCHVQASLTCSNNLEHA